MNSQEEQNSAAMRKSIQAAFTANASVALNDNFRLADVWPVTGAYYFGLTCKGCRKNSPAVEDDFRGEFEEPFAGPGSLTWTCIYCNTTIRAPAKDIKSFRVKTK